MSIVLRFFPNGEFSQGVNTSLQRRDKRKHPLGGIHKRRDEKGNAEILYQARNAEIPEATLQAYIGRDYISRSAYTYTILEVGQDYTCIGWQDASGQYYDSRVEINVLRLIKEWGMTPLGSSDARILTKPPQSRKKCKAMTKNMARNIRNGVYLLEEKYGKDNLSFLTLTLPNLSAEGLASCCANWDKMVHNFIKWLRTKAEKHGFAIDYVYCTEIQTKRLQNRGEYAPHLHIVFRGRIGRKHPWIITPRMARQEWVRQVKSYTSETFTDTAIENLQRIKKSAARYLSKYMSKGNNSNTCGDAGSVTQDLHTQWGGLSRQLSRAIRTNTIRLESSGEPGTFAACFIGSIQTLVDRGIVKYYKRGFISVGKGDGGNYERYLKVLIGCLARPLNKGIIEDCMKVLEDLHKSAEITYC